MNQSKALEIVKNLNSDKYTQLEKIEAIVIVSQMRSFAQVKKEHLVYALRVMVELSADLVLNGNNTETAQGENS